jgi:hypothetical protein
VKIKGFDSFYIYSRIAVVKAVLVTLQAIEYLLLVLRENSHVMLESRTNILEVLIMW